MSYELNNRLVIGLSSSALFDLKESDHIFQTQGEEHYRLYQQEHQNAVLSAGVAFPFIKKLLSINEINPENSPIEVILLSKNDPYTGLRVMNSIQHYNLDITRALFLQGKHPYPYIDALSIDLFLSANQYDVQQAIGAGCPAGQVLNSHFDQYLLEPDSPLVVALDFDGVIIDDEAEQIYQDKGLESFQNHEQKHAYQVHNAGPLANFLKQLSAIQKQEQRFAQHNKTYTPKLRIAIVTARNAPAHKRAINTMQEWNIIVNEAFFLGGIEKKAILAVLKPHIFFDDQMHHLDGASDILPCVHIPFGVSNTAQ